MGQKEETEEKQERNNFAKGSIVVNILKLAVPMTLAQLINVLGNKGGWLSNYRAFLSLSRDEYSRKSPRFLYLWCSDD